MLFTLMLLWSSRYLVCCPACCCAVPRALNPGDLGAVAVALAEVLVDVPWLLLPGWRDAWPGIVARALTLLWAAGLVVLCCC